MFEEEKKEEENNNQDVLNNILKTEHRKIVENIFDSDKEKIIKINKTSLFAKVLFALIFLLVIAVVVLVLIFFKFNKEAGDEISLSDVTNKIIVNIDSKSGVNENGQIQYVLSFKNTEKYKMKNIELSARFPVEFSYVSADKDPYLINDEYIKWKIDDLDPNQETFITLNGYLFGAVGVESVFSVTMNYNFDNMSSNFSSNNSYKIVISKSMFDIVVDRTDVFNTNSDIVYKLKIKNNSLKALKNLKISFRFPEYFKINKFSEEPFKVYQNEQIDWIFDLSKKQEDQNDPTKDEYYEKIITINGIVESNNNDVNFSISSGIVPDMSRPDDFSIVFFKDDIIRTSMSGLSFNTITSSPIEDNNNEKQAVANVNNGYKISFKYKKTNPDLTFKDLRLVVEFLGDDVIDKKITFNIAPKFTNEIVNGFSNYIIEWNSSNNSNFKNLSETEKELNLTLNFKKDILTKYKEGGYYSNVKATLYGKSGTSTKESVLIEGKIFKLILDTNLNTKLSSSKVNLKSGVESTPVELSLNITNNYNKISGSAVYFTLPEGVVYTSDSILSKSKKIDYDLESRKISWVIGDMDYQESVSGKFYVTVTPDSKNIGKNIDLTSKINIIYRDETIKKDFSLNFDSIKSINKVVK